MRQFRALLISIVVVAIIVVACIFKHEPEEIESTVTYTVSFTVTLAAEDSLVGHKDLQESFEYYLEQRAELTFYNRLLEYRPGELGIKNLTIE